MADTTSSFITGIEHVLILATQPDELSAWYQRVLGATLAYASDKVPRTYLVRLGHDLIEIGPQSQNSAFATARNLVGFRHIALSVDDFDTAVDILRERGVAFAGPESKSHLDSRAIFFADLEGNQLHLLWRPKTIR